MQTLFGLLTQITPVPIRLREYLETYLKRLEVRKKTILLKPGQTAKNIYFIEKGLVRGFHYEKGKERTSWIMKENDFILSVESFFLREPSEDVIEIMEDTILYSLTYEQLENAYVVSPGFNEHSRIILQKYYPLSEKRHKMRSKHARDRFKYLMHHHADLVGRVSDKILASYLGISVSAFAIEKKNFARGK